MYIGYPIIGTVDGAYPIDALWISPQKGLVAFNLFEGKNFERYEDSQDDCANKLDAKLRGYRQLMERRTLCVENNVVTFAPAVTKKLAFSLKNKNICIFVPPLYVEDINIEYTQVLLVMLTAAE